MATKRTARKTKQHRWEINNGLEWALRLSDALSNYTSDLRGNPEYIESSRKHLLEKFRLPANDVDCLADESLARDDFKQNIA